MWLRMVQAPFRCSSTKRWKVRDRSEVIPGSWAKFWVLRSMASTATEPSSWAVTPRQRMVYW